MHLVPPVQAGLLGPWKGRPSSQWAYPMFSQTNFISVGASFLVPDPSAWHCYVLQATLSLQRDFVPATHSCFLQLLPLLGQASPSVSGHCPCHCWCTGYLEVPEPQFVLWHRWRKDLNHILLPCPRRVPKQCGFCSIGFLVVLTAKIHMRDSDVSLGGSGGMINLGK